MKLLKYSVLSSNLRCLLFIYFFLIFIVANGTVKKNSLALTANSYLTPTNSKINAANNFLERRKLKRILPQYFLKIFYSKNISGNESMLQ